MSLSIRQHFANLLEIPETHGDLIYSEARNKIVGTYIVLNGKLVFLCRMENRHIEVNNGTDVTIHDGSEISTLSYFLPDSGCYKVRGRYEYLQKIAKRQWKKSFSWSYYSLTNRDHDEDAFALFGQTPISMFEDKGMVFYNRLRVAKKQSNGSYTLEVPDLQHELDEFLNRKVDGS